MLGVPYDTTLFISASLKEVVITLVQAVSLVILIIFIFLQDWRATLIPAIAIPVALIGAMIGLKAMGFELNTLTLFACTLATGLVVDDAIVVGENVYFYRQSGLGWFEAAVRGAREIAIPSAYRSRPGRD